MTSDETGRGIDAGASREGVELAVWTGAGFSTVSCWSEGRSDPNPLDAGISVVISAALFSSSLWPSRATGSMSCLELSNPFGF